MNKLISKLVRLPKKLVKGGIGLLPAPRSRLTGTLAKDGGIPVRDTRFRPWPNFPSSSRLEWRYRVAPAMRTIFRSGVEGLPQPLANEFAKRWAEYCGARYALLLPHGTDALRFALAAALNHDGLEYGGEVIVPNLTFIASATAALDRRFGVAFVDVDPGTLTIDPRRVEEAIIPGKTRAIMAVHLFGHPADMSALRDIAGRHSLVLIEDAAQAHGAIHELGRVGSIGHASGFSFQSSKNLTSGEGGALTTNDPEIFERAYGFHNVGRTRAGAGRWSHMTLGWNCRPSEYVAAVLLHRLRTLETEQQRRYARFLSLRDRLSEVTCVESLGVGPWVKRHGVYMFVMRYRAEQCGGLDIQDFLRAVQAEGIPAHRAHEMTLTQTPALQRLAEKHPDYLRALPTPVANQAAEEIIYIPHHVFLGNEGDMSEIAAAFRKIEAHYAPKRSRNGRRPAMDLSATAVSFTPTSAPSSSSGTRPIRFGIIGLGFMGCQHAEAISANPRLTLVGVTDLEQQKASEISEKFGCKAFSSAEDLVSSGEVDAVVIATPHWQHAGLAITGLRAALHVVCEKPLTVTINQADEVLRVARESSSTLAVVHQYRFEPAYQYAKKILESGELGPIYRCSMVESSWRTEAYYQSSPWRGTWKGEGGGVLLNQAPHILDRYVWLCGMPDTVFARCDTNLHQIEVEDIASAILHHANGMHGYVHVNTLECPAISQTIISCDRGRITIENGSLRISKLKDSIRHRTSTDSGSWGDLNGRSRTIRVPLAKFHELLNMFYNDFVKAVAGDGKLTCPGREGRNAVELANAMILSSVHGRAITLPLDRDEYAEFITRAVGRPTTA